MAATSGQRIDQLNEIQPVVGTRLVGLNPSDSAAGRFTIQEATSTGIVYADWYVAGDDTDEHAGLVSLIAAAQGKTIIFTPGKNYRGKQAFVDGSPTSSDRLDFEGVRGVIATGATFNRLHIFIGDNCDWTGGSFIQDDSTWGQALVQVTGSNVFFEKVFLQKTKAYAYILVSGTTRPENILIQDVNCRVSLDTENVSDNDGLVIFYGKNVWLNRCTVETTGDDGITIKCTRDNGVTENIWVTNCVSINTSGAICIVGPFGENAVIRNVFAHNLVGINTRPVNIRTSQSAPNIGTIESFVIDGVTCYTDAINHYNVSKQKVGTSNGIQLAARFQQGAGGIIRNGVINNVKDYCRRDNASTTKAYVYITADKEDALIQNVKITNILGEDPAQGEIDVGEHETLVPVQRAIWINQPNDATRITGLTIHGVFRHISENAIRANISSDFVSGIELDIEVNDVTDALFNVAVPMKARVKSNKPLASWITTGQDSLVDLSFEHEEAFDASAGDGNTTLVGAMQWDKTYLVEIEETEALDGNASTTFRLGTGAGAEDLLTAVTATGSTLARARIDGIDHVGDPLVLSWTNNASATTGELTATVKVVG